MATVGNVTEDDIKKYIQEQPEESQKVIDSLSFYLTKEYERGFSRSNVAGMRQFYMTYKDRK